MLRSVAGSLSEPGAGSQASLRMHRRTDQCDEFTQSRLRRYGLSHHPIIDDLILIAQQAHEVDTLLIGQVAEGGFKKPVEQQIQFQHATPALPAQTLYFLLNDQGVICGIFWIGTGGIDVGRHL